MQRTYLSSFFAFGGRRVCIVVGFAHLGVLVVIIGAGAAAYADDVANPPVLPITELSRLPQREVSGGRANVSCEEARLLRWLRAWRRP